MFSDTSVRLAKTLGAYIDLGNGESRQLGPGGVCVRIAVGISTGTYAGVKDSLVEILVAQEQAGDEGPLLAARLRVQDVPRLESVDV